MPLIFQPRPRLLRPTWPSINWNHRITRGLTSCFIPLFPGVLVDLVKKRPNSTSGTSSIGRFGQSVGGTWSVGAVGDTADLNWTSGPFSVAVWANLPAASANYRDIFTRDSYTNESTNAGWGFQIRSTGDAFPGINFIIFNNNGGGGSPRYNFNSTATYAGGDQMIVGSSDGSGSKYIYNNLFKDSSTTGNFVPATNTALGLAVGDGLPKIYIGCTWNRQLSDAEVYSFYYYPFAMIGYGEDRAEAQIIGTATGGGGFTPKYRKTRSPIGTRVGSRQAGAA